MKEIKEFAAKSDEELRAILKADGQLSDQLLMGMPELSNEIGLDVFSRDWIRKYSKRILAEVSGEPVDLAFKWALGVSALQLAELLSQNFGLEAVSWSAAVALALLLLRAARHEKKSNSREQDERESEGDEDQK